MALLILIGLAQLAVIGRLLFVVVQFMNGVGAQRALAENSIRGAQQQTVVAMFEAARASGLEGWGSAGPSS